MMNKLGINSTDINIEVEKGFVNKTLKDEQSGEEKQILDNKIL